MKNKLVPFDPNDVNILENIKNLSKPKNKLEAISNLHLLLPIKSFLSKMSKLIKEREADQGEYLDKNCVSKDCNTFFSDGIGVKKVVSHKKIYNDEELDSLLEKVKARKKILERKHEDGEVNEKGEDYITKKENTPYFKIEV